jgi:hypothetical protein
MQPNRVVWLYLLAAFAGIVCVGLFVHGVRLVRVKDVQTAVAQGLAPGSDEPTVRRFMDSHHIVYAGYSPELHRSYGKIYRASYAGFSYRVAEVYDSIWE